MILQKAPNFNSESILAAVSELGIGSFPSLDGKFSGDECHVFKISFRDEASVAVRVPHAAGDISHDDMIASTRIEMHVLQRLEAKGFPWAPKCLVASLTFDNPVKNPFLVLTWAEGSPLKWDENFPPRPFRDALLGQIASIQLSLIAKTIENGTQAI